MGVPELRRKARRIRRDGRSRTQDTGLAGRGPGDVEADRRRRLARPEDLERVDDRKIVDDQCRGVTVVGQGAVGNAEGPEKTGGRNAAVAVVDLLREARTGLVEVHSDEDKRAVVVGAVVGDVVAAIDPHVVHHVVVDAVAPMRSPDEEGDGGESVEVGDHI